MTVDQLYAGSTFPFRARLGPTVSNVPPARDWMINEPYDLTFVYKGHVLHEEDLGGDNYLLAITTDSIRGPVDSVHVTYQNRALTLDEALAVSKRLRDWFAAAGFHPLSAADPEPHRIVAPFFIETQEQSAPHYSREIASFQDARAAFLDPRAQLIKMIPFVLETEDVGVGLDIVNARRQREDFDAHKNEVNLSTEREYFVSLSIAARNTASLNAAPSAR